MSQQSTGFSDDERLVVGPRRAAHMLDCGLTRVYELIKTGELDSYFDGGRKIPVATIKARIERQLAAAQAAPEARENPTARAVAARKAKRAAATSPEGA
jgi:hypothetical protein